MKKTAIQIYVTLSGVKYKRDIADEEFVRIARRVYDFIGIISSAAEETYSKPVDTLGSVSIRFSRLPNRKMKISTDYKVASFASSRQQAIVLELYKNLSESLKD